MQPQQTQKFLKASGICLGDEKNKRVENIYGNNIFEDIKHQIIDKNSNFKILESKIDVQESVMTPAFKWRMQSYSSRGKSPTSKMKGSEQCDSSISQLQTPNRREQILAKGFLQSQNGATANQQAKNLLNIKNDEKKKKILDLNDLLPEKRQPYYMYMPDEEERKKYQAFAKRPTLELPSGVQALLSGFENNIFSNNNEQEAKIYPNLTQNKVTLVFELYDILVKIIDPKKDSINISDENIKCFDISLKPRQTVFMKFNETVLLNILRRLQGQAELILYSCLPESLIQAIIYSEDSCLHELSTLFSYVFSQKDCIVMEDEVVLKDLAKLLPTRSKDQIVVVDTIASNVDNDVNAFIFQNKYKGDNNYPELCLLETALNITPLASLPNNAYNNNDDNNKNENSIQVV